MPPESLEWVEASVRMFENDGQVPFIAVVGVTPDVLADRNLSADMIAESAAEQVADAIHRWRMENDAAS